MKYIFGISAHLLSVLAFTGVVTADPGSLKEPVQLKVMSYNIRFGELASLEELAAYIKSEDPGIVAKAIKETYLIFNFGFNMSYINLSTMKKSKKKPSFRGVRVDLCDGSRGISC